MKPVLVVEDSTMVMKIIKHVLSQSQLIDAVYAENFADAKQLVERAEPPFFAALVDLSLPDAPNGEIVDYVLAKSIPTIVLTGSFDEKRRTQMLAKGIVDYVTKEGRYSYELALGTLHRLIKNTTTKVLVVDDSRTQRKMLNQLLRLHLFQVLEAEDGVAAIKVILDEPDIRLLITDFNMPRMDGFELIKNLRVKYEKTDLIIIGLSSESERTLSAKFIKYGANDFLQKPFNHEEFFCRINHNVEFLELIQTIRDAADRDELTGIYNRRYFFRNGEAIFQQSRTHNNKIALAVIDLYHFGQINELHGNDSGDALLVQVSSRLAALYERFLFVRSDGNLFYLLLPGFDNEKATAYVERVRQLISAEHFDVDEELVNVSYTGGVSSRACDSLDELLASAEKCLLRAKEAGGDLVFGD